MNDAPSKSSFPRWLIMVVIGLVVAVAVGGYLFYRDQSEGARSAAEDQLHSIAQLKIDQIAQWRDEELADAAAISGSPLAAELVLRWLESGQAADEAQILSWLETLRDNYQYSGITLADPAGAPLLALDASTGVLTEAGVSGIRAAVASGQPVLTDLHFDVDGTIHIDTIAPLFAPKQDGSTEPLGAVVLHQPASEFLYPLVQSWPTPSETAEILLVRREGDSVVFLNQLRFEDDTALRLSFPLTEADLPAVMAVEGDQGFVEAADYRGVPVLAELQPIPDSPWFMVAKVDVSEALAGTLFRSGLVFGAFGIVLAATIIGSLLLWQWGLRRRYQDAYALEATQRGLMERFEHVVRQAGDAIFLADESLQIVEANDQAVRVYGYTHEELLNLRISDVVPPEGLPDLENRIADARSGGGSTHETFHVRKDGSAFPVEVSDRLIVFEGRNYYQAIARDISLRKQAEDALRRSEERYRSLAAENERLYEQQFEIAQSLQEALLHIPSELASLRFGHLYRSATEAARVGGDFYDVFELRGGKIAVLIGDVAGHGIEAARMAALTKDVIHAFAHQTRKPEQILRRANSLLVEKGLGGGFVTVFLSVFDPETGVFRYANAGHPRTFLRRSSGEVEHLADGAPPMGVFPEARAKVGETELHPDDLLLLYTDGVIEARRNGEFFGEERLQAILRSESLSVERLPGQIFDEVLAFADGTLKDDVAILSLLVTEKVPT